MLGRIRVYLIMFAAFAAFAGVAYWYYKDTQAALQQYAINQANLETSLTLQRSATESLKQDITRMSNTLVQLNADFAQSRAQVTELENKFNQSSNGDDRDFGVLAARKPALVEKIVNTATQDVLRCFELLSGDSAQQGEATNEKFSSCIASATDASSMQ